MICFFSSFSGKKNVDDVAVGLRHFLAVGAGYRHHGLLNSGLGQHKNLLAGDAVEGFGDVAGDFKVLALVFTDRNQVGVVQQDVGGHEHRVVKEAGVDVAQAI